MITISAFASVPDIAKGQVRDLRARWACEEAGLPYRTRLLQQGEQDAPEYRALPPFGQVPILEDDGLVLFESGAIALYIAERSQSLLPSEPHARARAIQWTIAALNSIEPWALNVLLIEIIYPGEEWAKLRREGAVAFLHRRLAALANALGEKPFLDGETFTVGDLLMASVLRQLDLTEHLNAHPGLGAYKARCEARPAFQRALAAQLADFHPEENAA